MAVLARASPETSSVSGNRSSRRNPSDALQTEPPRRCELPRSHRGRLGARHYFQTGLPRFTSLGLVTAPAAPPASAPTTTPGGPARRPTPAPIPAPEAARSVVVVPQADSKADAKIGTRTVFIGSSFQDCVHERQRHLNANVP